jgi:hypothetical protein
MFQALSIIVSAMSAMSVVTMRARRQTDQFARSHADATAIAESAVRPAATALAQTPPATRSRLVRRSARWA